MTVMMLFVTMTIMGYSGDFSKDGLYYEITSNSNYTVRCIGWDGEPTEVSIPSKVMFNRIAYIVVGLGGKDVSFCGKLKIPATVKTVDPSHFYVTSIEVDKSSQYLITLDGILYSSDYKTLIWCPQSVTELVMPDETEKIGNYAHCGVLKSVVFSKALTKIGKGSFVGSNLTSITIPENLIEIEPYTFSGAHLTSIIFSKVKKMTKIDSYAFRGCKGLSSITFPDNLDEISENAFAECENLYSIVLPKSSATIWGEAFLGCKKIREVWCRNSSLPYFGSDTLAGYEFEEDVYLYSTLYVPIGSKHLYEWAMPWRNFLNIQEWDFAGVESTMEQNEEQIEGIYSVEGIPISSDDTGIQIIKYSDGSVKKIIKR